MRYNKRLYIVFSHARVMVIGVNDIDHTCFLLFFLDVGGGSLH